MLQRSIFLISVAFITGLLLLFIFFNILFNRNGRSLPCASPTLSKPRCSFELYRKLSTENTDGNIEGRGYWARKRNGDLLQFHPAICQLSHGKWIPTTELSACFKRNKLGRIAVVGDSNARYYTHALHMLLKGQPGKSSSIICSELYTRVNITYASHSSPTMFIKRRCRCGGFCTFEGKIPGNRLTYQAACVHGDRPTMPLVMEYVPLMNWQSGDPYTVLGCSRGATEPVIVAADTQEYTFSDYLTDPRPDVIILVANMHDDFPLSNTSAIERQLDLLDRFVSNTTQVVLVTLHIPVLATMPSIYANYLIPGEDGVGIHRDEWARQLNRIIFRLARERFVAGRSPLLVPNMAQVSSTVADLCPDGAHMSMDWYQHIMSAIVQHLCDK